MARPILLVAAALSALAALVHFIVMPHHFEEYAAQGIFFLLLAIAQTILAIELVRNPRHLMLIGGIFGNIVVLVVYVVSRTLGVPGGAHGGEPEPVGVLDALATVSEIILVALLFAQLRHYPDTHDARAGATSPRSPSRGPPRPRASPLTVNP